MNILFMAKTFKKPQGVLGIGTSLLSAFGMVPFHGIVNTLRCLCWLEFICQSVNSRYTHGSTFDRVEPRLSYVPDCKNGCSPLTHAVLVRSAMMSL